MINKNNELPSFVNENNLPKIVDKLSNASNIKITGNKYGNRVQTVIDKIVEKADDVTKAIKQEVINDNYSFKVGTGNVDVSTDVQDGFGEVGVKGVTYHNLCDVSKSYQNLSFVAIKDGSIEFLELGADTTRTIFNDMTLLKPNTQYTIIANCEKMCSSNEQNIPIRMNNDGTDYNINVFGLNVEKVGITSMLFTTPSDVSNLKLLFYNNPRNAGFKFKYILILEGDHANNPNLPSYFKDIVGVGDKSKNLFNGELELGGYTGSAGAPFVDSTRVRTKTKILLSSGDYVVSSKESILISVCEYNVDGTFIREYYANSNNKYFKLEGDRLVHFQTVNPNLLNSKIQLEKGTKATSYEPYYDGHKIEILSNGKNLYKPNLQTKSVNGLTFSLHGNTLIVNGTCTKYVDFRPVTTTLELYTYVNKLPIGTTLNLSNNLGLKNYFGLKRNGAQTYLTNTLIIQEGDYDISCFVRFEEGQSYNNQQLNIQLEINSKATEFEPYVEDKTQILLDEPLMKLPNGVCDEITRDGKLIRRVGKTVIDENVKYLGHNATSSNHNQFVVHDVVTTPNALNHADLLCDKKTCKVENSGNDSVWVYNKRTLVFQMNATINDVLKMRQWLSENPTTVYYELEAPVVTELPAPCLRIFKDGHLTFNTLVAPESTHVVQLNKSGQIQNAIKESQSLDNRINILENNYDNLILFTMSRLSDLELNYTLK